MKSLHTFAEVLDSFQLSVILGGDGGPVILDDQDIDMPDLKPTP
jgi:hypothetical protein